MSKYDSIPILSARQKARRLLIAFFILVAMAAIYTSIPGFHEWARSIPEWISLGWLLLMWVYIGWAYCRTILRIDILGGELIIQRPMGLKRIPLSSIAEIEPVHRKGKLVRICLRDQSTHPLPTVPIVSGSRQIENEEELLQELASISQTNLGGGGVPPPVPLV